VILGALGSLIGVTLGMGLMWLLMPRSRSSRPAPRDLVHLPIYWGWEQYLLAVGFAHDLGGGRGLSAGAQGRAGAAGGDFARSGMTPILAAERLGRVWPARCR
jgi:hypothetical protein